MDRLISLVALLCGLLLAPSALAETVHKVRSGETLGEIADAYNVSVKDLMAANSIKNANQIRVGQKLTIPGEPIKYVEYKIRNGDSLSEIAKKYGVSQKQIQAFNAIRNANQIRVGQVIRIPYIDGKEPVPGPDAKPWDALPETLVQALDAIHPKAGRWKHIVIHHSATGNGSAAGMDRYHREEQRMQNGLAYHFVIGNGKGMGDGEIAIGNRWKQQIQGGHVSSEALNQVSIGICLVGNFENNRPTRRQMEQLKALLAYLLDKVDLPPERVTTHTLIHPKHTDCPGKHFPTESLRKDLEKLGQ